MKLVTLKVTASRNIAFAKKFVPPILWQAAYRAAIIKNIPNNYAYAPHYSPWLEPAFKARVESVRGNTGLVPQSIYTLLHFLSQSLSRDGDVVECGVWRGGTAKLLREELMAAAGTKGAGKTLHLFDSFEGMAAVDSENDRHEVGDFANTSLDHVKRFVTGNAEADPAGIAQFHKGWIPDTFAGLDEVRLCFAHIDLDLYQSILDSLAFVYPRLLSGGAIVFDDYGFASCPGARRAVDEYFADKPEKPFALGTGQGLVIKL